MNNKMQSAYLVPACFTLLVISGCTFVVQPALVPNRNVEQWTVADANDYGITLTRSADGTCFYSWNHSVSFDPNNAAMPAYGHRYFWQIASAVRGQLNGRTYFTVWDTGASPFIMIEDTQINRHKMPVIFFKPDDKSDSAGLAFAESLQVGPIQYDNAPCVFLKHHAEHRLLGLVPVHRFEWMVLPLDLMAAFGHIEFDQVANEIRLSETEPFRPDDPSQWLALAFEIRQSGMNRLLLQLPVEGIPTTLFLDTGAAYELFLSNELMQRLHQKRPDFLEARTRRTHIYIPYAGGMINSRKFTAGNVHLADRTFDRIEVFYREKDPDPALPFDGIIGINLFRDTVMVLDFKQNLMWVKKTKGSLFEETASDGV
jgi:hypothetical protein